VIKNLKDGDITVSLFIDPDLDQIRAAHKLGAERVELHTGRYCEAPDERERVKELSRITDAAKAATKLGMGVAAGHGLNTENVTAIARIKEIDELNIGHAIVSRAVFIGFERAVREMLDLMRMARF
jgi:pyridoxine 5-phosphate synthase